jgi:hypothetical protein
MTNQKRYRAFISYSQQNKLAAQRLHRWLETYRIPTGITADSNRRLGRFFRDDEEMGAAADIGAAVRGAIEDSESLIVLCTPRSAKSRWVAAEIEYFRRTGRSAKVFAVIMDGVPNADDPATECFPQPLRAAGGADPTAMPIEPLGLDLLHKERLSVISSTARTATCQRAHGSRLPMSNCN